MNQSARRGCVFLTACPASAPAHVLLSLAVYYGIICGISISSLTGAASLPDCRPLDSIRDCEGQCKEQSALSHVSQAGGGALRCGYISFVDK